MAKHLSNINFLCIFLLFIIEFETQRLLVNFSSFFKLMRMNIDGNLNIKHVGFLFSLSSVKEILKLTLNLHFSSLFL